MRHILIAILTITYGIATAAQTDIVEQADSAYIADDFTQAAQLYQTIINHYGPTPQRYHNLGNALWRAGQTGKAIVAYERGLRLNPADADLKANLEYVNSRLTDRTGATGTTLSRLTDTIVTTTTPDTWAILALITFILTLTGLALYIFTGKIALRKTGFFGALGAICLCITFTLLAFRAASISKATDKAIIIVPSVILSTAPRTPIDRSGEAMLLHEGTRLEIIDSVSTRTPADTIPTVWLDVAADNEHRAWIPRTAVEII